MKVLLVADVAAPDLPTVQTMLDHFREAVQPSSEYGIMLSLATADDIKELAPTSTLPAEPESCEECGAVVPDSATAVEGMWHQPSCSLHMEAPAILPTLNDRPAAERDTVHE